MSQRKKIKKLRTDIVLLTNIVSQLVAHIEFIYDKLDKNDGVYDEIPSDIGIAIRPTMLEHLEIHEESYDGVHRLLRLHHEANNFPLPHPEPEVDAEPILWDDKTAAKYVNERVPQFPDGNIFITTSSGNKFTEPSEIDWSVELNPEDRTRVPGVDGVRVGDITWTPGTSEEVINAFSKSVGDSVKAYGESIKQTDV